MSGIGIVLNPHSRSNRKNPGRLRKLGFIVGDRGSCHETQDLKAVEELAQEFKERQIEILGISGGDGTIHQTLTTFLNVYGDQPFPKIALLRGGTMNTVATNLNISGGPEKILSDLIVRYHSADSFETRRIDMLHINENYGFLFGVGIFSRFIELYMRKQGSVPWAAYLFGKTIVTCFLQSKFARRLCERFDAIVTINGKPWPYANYNSIFSGTIEGLGFGFKTLFRAEENLGELHVRAFSMLPRQIACGLPGFLLGRPITESQQLESAAREVVITLKDAQTYMLDGEIYGPVETIKMTAGPALEFILQ